MMQQELVNFHPLINTMTLCMAPQDILHFIKHLGHPVRVQDLSAAAP
jgi:Ala-tRNA(Pro) deacylase